MRIVVFQRFWSQTDRGKQTKNHAARELGLGWVVMLSRYLRSRPWKQTEWLCTNHSKLYCICGYYFLLECCKATPSSNKAMNPMIRSIILSQGTKRKLRKLRSNVSKLHLQVTNKRSLLTRDRKLPTYDRTLLSCDEKKKKVSEIKTLWLYARQ